MRSNSPPNARNAVSLGSSPDWAKQSTPCDPIVLQRHFTLLFLLASLILCGWLCFASSDPQRVALRSQTLQSSLQTACGNQEQMPRENPGTSISVSEHADCTARAHSSECSSSKSIPEAIGNCGRPHEQTESMAKLAPARTVGRDGVAKEYVRIQGSTEIVKVIALRARRAMSNAVSAARARMHDLPDRLKPETLAPGRVMASWKHMSRHVKKLLEWHSTLIIVKDTKMVLRTMVGSKWTRVAIVALVVLFVDHVLFV